MTARYSSGTYANPLALLTALDAYLVDVIGWTRNMGPTAVSGKSGRRAHYQKIITKNGVSRTVYWNLWATGASEVQGTSSAETPSGASYTGLYSYPSTGFDAGLAWDRQPGYPVSQTSIGLFPFCLMELAPAVAPRYAFFGSAAGDAYIVVEKTSGTGYCGFVAAGVLDKRGAGMYEGGEFAGATKVPGTSGTVSTNSNFEIPFYSITAANTTIFVRATVDGSADWATVQAMHSTAADLATKTSLLGVGNIGFLDAQHPDPVTKSIPCANIACQGLSSVNGVTLPRELQVAVWRSAKGKFSLLGTMPLISWCPIVVQDGLPWGTILQDRFYSQFLAIEQRDE